jgi:hypothetical protein
MESFSVWHWIIFIAVLIVSVVSPILGIVRGIKNGAVIPAILSVVVPMYGLIYFFAAKLPRR